MPRRAFQRKRYKSPQKDISRRTSTLYSAGGRGGDGRGTGEEGRPLAEGFWRDVDTPLVCVIEDEPSVQRFLAGIFIAEGYRVVGVPDGRHALRVIAEHQPDLVVLDLAMPGADLEICRHLRADPRSITLPIIIVTARGAVADIVAGLDAGADDFVTKPFQPSELLARMRTAIRMRGVVLRMDEAKAIVAALANAVEAKDATLDGHCRRMAHHAARLAGKVGLVGPDLDGVAYGALLHDVGKIAIPEPLLHKMGPLTAVDRAVLARHPEIGERICGPLRSARTFTPIIRHHHERWDGGGYPDGLRHEAIPLGARIVAVADAYDAIHQGRPYRPARSMDEAFDELRRHSGRQFDPMLVPIFIDEVGQVEAGLPPGIPLPPAAVLVRAPDLAHQFSAPAAR